MKGGEDRGVKRMEDGAEDAISSPSISSHQHRRGEEDEEAAGSGGQPLEGGERDMGNREEEREMGMEDVQRYLEAHKINARIVDMGDGGEGEEDGTEGKIDGRIKSLVFTVGEERTPLVLVCPGKRTRPS